MSQEDKMEEFVMKSEIIIITVLFLVYYYRVSKWM